MVKKFPVCTPMPRRNRQSHILILRTFNRDRNHEGEDPGPIADTSGQLAPRISLERYEVAAGEPVGHCASNSAGQAPWS